MTTLGAVTASRGYPTPVRRPPREVSEAVDIYDGSIASDPTVTYNSHRPVSGVWGDLSAEIKGLELAAGQGQASEANHNSGPWGAIGQAPQRDGEKVKEKDTGLVMGRVDPGQATRSSRALRQSTATEYLVSSATPASPVRLGHHSPATPTSPSKSTTPQPSGLSQNAASEVGGYPTTSELLNRIVKLERELTELKSSTAREVGLLRAEIESRGPPETSLRLGGANLARQNSLSATSAAASSPGLAPSRSPSLTAHAPVFIPSPNTGTGHGANGFAMHRSPPQVSTSFDSVASNSLLSSTPASQSGFGNPGPAAIFGAPVEAHLRSLSQQVAALTSTVTTLLSQQPSNSTIAPLALNPSSGADHRASPFVGGILPVSVGYGMVGQGAGGGMSGMSPRGSMNASYGDVNAWETAAAGVPGGIGDERRRGSLLLPGGNSGSPALAWDGMGLGSSTATAAGMGGVQAPAGSLYGKWEQLGLSGDLLHALMRKGGSSRIGPPTKTQIKVVPLILRSQDIIAQANAIQERIQSYVIPAISLIVSPTPFSAPAGSAVGGIPHPAMRGLQVIIICATVDEAMQAHRLAEGLGSLVGVKALLATSAGAMPGDASAEASKIQSASPHILVGTPQRMLELLATHMVETRELALLVLDEVDQIVARGLQGYVVCLVKFLNGFKGQGPAPSTSKSRKSPLGPLGGEAPLPYGLPMDPYAPAGDGSSPQGPARKRQTCLFSCTVPQELLNFAEDLKLSNAARILVRRDPGEGSSPSVRGLKQYFFYIATPGPGRMKATRPSGPKGLPAAGVASKEWKLDAVTDLMHDLDFPQCVVYCSSVDAVEAVSRRLAPKGIDALALHQDMGAADCHSVLSKFRGAAPAAGGSGGGGAKKALVVYDVLARTMSDVCQVPLVINFDLPRAVEDYVHRVACAVAGGFGRPGLVINIAASGSDMEMIRSIETFYRCKLHELPHNLTLLTT